MARAEHLIALADSDHGLNFMEGATAGAQLAIAYMMLADRLGPEGSSPVTPVVPTNPFDQASGLQTFVAVAH